MKSSPFSILFLAFILLVSCGQEPGTAPSQESETTEDNAKTVSFKGRTIDLQPYVEGFPYSGFTPSYAAGKVFYQKRGKTTDLLELDLTGKPDLSKGRKISDIDFATRNVWGIRYNKADQLLYWMGDERNDEVINLTRHNPETGETEKLTDVPYIFGYRWNEDQNKIAYVARLGDKEDRLGELRIFDLTNKTEEAILQDQADMRFTWGSPSWQPGGKGLVLTALRDADRTYGNLLFIDLEKKTQTLLTDKSKARSYPSAFKEWIDENTLLYVSNEDGFRNAYRYDLKNKKATQLTQFTSDMGSSEIVTIEGQKYLFATTSTPIEDQLYLIDLASGDVVHQQPSDVSIGVYDGDGDKMIVSVSSNTSMFKINEMQVAKDKFSMLKTLVDVPEKLKTQVYNTEVERISYPTFDKDDKTGEPRMLHAYLYKPKNPLPKEEQVVMIQSFYGGGNSFSMRYQILADAGIYVLSPSPRGSRGFGREFAALNDKDLGGNEIIDVFYAAKYISEKLGIPPKNIGVFGGSHGGYATMRVLTFPGEINGQKTDFDWGFGLSHAGFSDIVHFYENCNIPDWVTLEAGDPKTEGEKLRDRSPLYHADKMKGQLLLTHGTNDSRVPIAGSRMMADSLKKYNKPVTLVEFEGQGHGIKGLDNTVTFYQTWFDFLETVTAGGVLN